MINKKKEGIKKIKYKFIYIKYSQGEFGISLSHNQKFKVKKRYINAPPARQILKHRYYIIKTHKMLAIVNIYNAKKATDLLEPYFDNLYFLHYFDGIDEYVLIYGQWKWGRI